MRHQQRQILFFNILAEWLYKDGQFQEFFSYRPDLHDIIATQRIVVCYETEIPHVVWPVTFNPFQPEDRCTGEAFFIYVRAQLIQSLQLFKRRHL